MESKINKYFLKEFLHYFIIVLFSVISVVWIAQAVNFLDLVVEDGHAIAVYFSYSILSIPKILTRLIPICFLVSLVLTIIKLEKDNELIVFWTSGLSKIKMVNFIFIISLIIMSFQLFMANTISPTSLNLSRTVLKNSSLEFFPTLIKEKQFNDTIEDVTFFVEKKSVDGSFENIFIRDHNKILSDTNQKSSTIFAKSGYILQNENSRHLVLYDGTIQKEKVSGKINFLKFDKTVLNIKNLAGKTIIQPKIQEDSSLRLLICSYGYDIFSSIPLEKFKSYSFKKFLKREVVKNDHNCKIGNKDTIIELNRRFGMPLYIPVLGLLGSFLLTTRQQSKAFDLYKFIFFFFGFVVLILAEISTRYSGIDQYRIYYYLIPFLSIPFIYLILLKNFKQEGMR